MLTQINFKIDEKLKKLALAKAKRTGISFSAYLRSASQEFVKENVSLAIVRNETLNNKTRKIHTQITKDLKNGKNISPAFSTSQKINEYLDTL
ncbi:MAG: hypothetical protein AAB682_02835 [Patescibacteria group bacterium]